MPRHLERIAAMDDAPVDDGARPRSLLTSGEPCLVLFLNREGRERHMVCRYQGAASRKPHLLTVFDLGKQAPRTVNLRTTFRVFDPATGAVLFDRRST